MEQQSLIWNLLILLLIGIVISIICNLISTIVSYYLIKWEIEEINEDSEDLKIDLLHSLVEIKAVFLKGIIYHKESWFFSNSIDYWRYNAYHKRHNYYMNRKDKHTVRV